MFSPWAMALAIFLLPALLLSVPHGVSLGALAIMATSLTCVRQWRPIAVETWRKTSWLSIGFVLYVVLVVSTVWLSGSPWNGLDNPDRFIWALLVIPALLVMKPDPVYYWAGLAVGAYGALLIALYDRFVLMLPRARGFHMEIMFGDLALALGLMAFCAWPIWKRAYQRWVLSFFPLFAGMLASILSGSRGGWLAFILCLPLLKWSAIRPRTLRGWVVMAAGIVSVLGVVISTPQLGVQQRLATAIHEWRLYQNSENYVTSVGQRLQMWQVSSHLIAEKPWTGWGFDGFEGAVSAKIEEGKADDAIRGFGSPHNQFLHMLVSGGVMGLAAWLAVFFLPLLWVVRCLRQKSLHPETRSLLMSGGTLIVAYCLFGLTQSMFTHQIGVTFYAFALAIIAGLSVAKEQNANG